MTNGTILDSIKESLQDILKEIRSGKNQLPDFQRGWIWDDNYVKSLLVSISVSYSIPAPKRAQKITGTYGLSALK